jgi:hypothetical protein
VSGATIPASAVAFRVAGSEIGLIDRRRGNQIAVDGFGGRPGRRSSSICRVL